MGVTSFLVASAILSSLFSLSAGADVKRVGAGNIDIAQVEQQIKEKVDAAYTRGKKLGYREGVFASQKHYVVEGETKGKKEG